MQAALDIGGGGTPARAMPRLLSKSDYAKHRGCAPSYVSKLIRLEKLKSPALRDDGLIDVVLADRMIEMQRDPARFLSEDEPPAPAASPIGKSDDQDEDETFASVRIETERLRQQHLAMQIAKEQGRLVPLEEVERERFTSGRAVRDEMLALPAELADQLAELIEPAEVRARLDQAIKQALTRAADRVRDDSDVAE